MDVPHGGRLKSVLRHVQQAVAAEAEKEKGFHTKNNVFRFRACALSRLDRQLLVLQRRHYGQRGRRDQIVGGIAAFPHFAHMA